MSGDPTEPVLPGNENVENVENVENEQVNENATGADLNTVKRIYSTNKLEFNTKKTELIKAINDLIALITDDPDKIGSLNAEKATLESINLIEGGRRRRKSRRSRRPRKSRRSRQSRRH